VTIRRFFRRTRSLLALCVLLIGLSGMNCPALLVDTFFGVDFMTNGDWTPSRENTVWSEEDTSPGTNFVGPGYGGQRYDVEALYVGNDHDNLYISLITGFRPTGHGRFEAGDLAIDFGSDGSYDTAVRANSVDGSLNPGNPGGALLMGVTDWTETSFPVKHAEAGDLRADSWLSTVFFGSNDDIFYGKWESPTGVRDGDHYAFEAVIPFSILGITSDIDYTVNWTMGCGNDYQNVDGHANIAPEPATLAMFLFGGGLLGLRRRMIRR